MAGAKYTFLDFAQEALKGIPKPLTFQELWAVGLEKGISSKLAISGKTPWQTLGARLFVDIRDNPETPFMKVGKNPARFWLASRRTELTEEDLKPEGPQKTTVAGKKPAFRFHERQLHPFVAYFAYSNTEFNRGRPIYTKTIYHEKSKHNALSEWVHPDMVGFYSPIDDWNPKLLELNRATDKTAIRLYSFEVKKQIDRGTYREYFFQAVSNSSWANKGYLVACSIQQQDDLLSEIS